MSKWTATGEFGGGTPAHAPAGEGPGKGLPLKGQQERVLLGGCSMLRSPASCLVASGTGPVCSVMTLVGAASSPIWVAGQGLDGESWEPALPARAAGEAWDARLDRERRCLLEDLPCACPCAWPRTQTGREPRAVLCCCASSA